MAKLIGRPSKFTPERRKLILERLRVGETIQSTCDNAGISQATYFEWLEIGRAHQNNEPHRHMPKSLERCQAYAEFYEATEAVMTNPHHWKRNQVRKTLHTKSAFRPIAIASRDSCCYLYLIQATNGLIKIGISNNPNKRLGALDTASPLELKLLHAFPDMFAYSSEQELHKLFASKRVRGEWFSLNEDDIAYIRRRYAKQSKQTTHPQTTGVHQRLYGKWL